MAARIDAAGADIAAVEARIEQVIAPFATVLDRLDEITGLGADGAATVFAETGWTCPGSPPQRICVPGPGCTARWLSTRRCDAAVLLEVERSVAPAKAQVAANAGHDGPASLVTISIPTSDIRTTTSCPGPCRASGASPRR